jgi:formylglycine-generating enzyme required for sulfatase activity
MKIFDNVGCEFIYNSNNTFTLLGPLSGYASLSIQDYGFSIPYLARNIDGKNIEYELGVGYLDKVDNKLVLKDKKISVSSNNNQHVDFSKNGNKQFYIFVHNVNFNNAFNNVFICNKDFNIEPRKSVYIVDVSSGYVTASLPDPVLCEAVELEFKTLGDSGVLSLNCEEFKLAIDSNKYTKLVSTGKDWIELKDNNTNNISSLSLSTDDSSFRVLGDPTGADRSLQFNNNGSFDDSSLYQGNNDKLLFGSSTESAAKNIIPSSGDHDLILNQTKDGSNFIVYGTGNAPGYPAKNLYFSYDGRLGINMPSGVNTGSIVKPSTILHVFNTLCREGIRLENRANCYPADITLYDNPFTSPRSNGSSIARIVFAGKDNASNKIDFATIETKIKSASSKLGQLDISVSNGASSKTTISTSSDRTKIESNNALIDVNTSSIRLSGTHISITGTNVGIAALSSVNLTGTAIVSTSLRLPYISSVNSLLSIDSSNRVIAATGFKIPGLSGGSEERLLSVKTDGTVVGQIPKDGVWPYETGQKIGGKDVIWDRYPYRTAQVCLNKITQEIEIENTPLEEFSIGDQIAILNLSNNTTIYRRIRDLTINNDIITRILIDQDVLFTGSTVNLKVYSVSKGGILTNTIYTSETISDATAIVLSSRPQANTVFNTKKKNIDFTVFGSEDKPAFNILANVGSNQNITGAYFKYATHVSGSPPTQSKIDSDGNGSINSSANNSANFADAADPVWSGKVTVVGNNGKPSYYKTFDQNGNVAEWVEDENKQYSYASYQYVCGGSWRTANNNSLRGYIATPRYSGLDDIGFRICSKAGYSHNLENALSIDFVRVDDINNPSDTSPIYEEAWTNRFNDTNDDPLPITKSDLGVVSYPFRISSYEVTNGQYLAFLNSVATGVSSISGLYKSSMTSSPVGGISVSGNGTSIPFTYYVKNNMESMPVVFVDYVSCIRYINWLSNGAPTGNNILPGITEFGAYSIQSGPGGTDQITKNRDQNYWLPSLNEWHKAAYYYPANEENSSPYSAITIRTDTPFEYKQAEPFVSGTGQIASVTISGLLYADYLKINPLVIKDLDRNYTTAIDPTETVVSVKGLTYFINQTGEDTGRLILRPDKTVFTQPVLVTTGVASTVDKSAGILIESSGISYVDSQGKKIPGGLFPGPNGGYLFKDPNGSNIISSSGNLISKSVSGEYLASITSIPNNSIVYQDNRSVLVGSSWFSVGNPPSNLKFEGGDKVVTISSSSTSESTTEQSEEDQKQKVLLYTDNLAIGPVLESYSGSLLTHGGSNIAYWQPNEFLRLPGAIWEKYPRRAIEFSLDPESDYTQIDSFRFVDIEPSDGGTGPVTVGELKNEFAINETIAIYNQKRNVIYVKISNKGLVDSRGRVVNSGLFTDESNLVMNVCPPIPADFARQSKLELAPDNTNDGRLIAYAFSVQKGGYLDMLMEPQATGVFSCEGLITSPTTTSEYKFKPGTSNTISLRPEIHTAFNKLAENIDFVVYGHRPTLFTRYENDWFDKDKSGLPTGLTPAFRINTKINNSVIGSLESGVLVQTIGETSSIATGILPDFNPKITINTKEPYRIATLNNIKQGILLPNSNPALNLELEKTYGTTIPITGVAISGTKDLSNYADLTIGGTTYTDQLITKDVVLGPLWKGVIPIPYELSLTQKVYAPNYPLTINNLGQIVSLIPPPAPTAPSAPLDLVANPKNNSVILTWNPPENDGGEPIIGYVVEFSIDDGNVWIIADQIDEQTLLPNNPDKNTIRILNSPTVTNNIGYIFRVRSYNSIGFGAYSQISTSVTPSSSLSPASVNNLRISQGEDFDGIRNSTNIVLSWDPVVSLPDDTTLQNYIVEYWIYNTLDNKDLKLATWTTAANSPVSPTSTSISIGGINTTSLYYFSVSTLASNGSSSSRSLYASLGSDPDPRPITNRRIRNNPNSYNFGSIIFTGSCS